MDILNLEFRAIEQIIIKVPWKQETEVCEYLRERGYRVASMYHTEDYFRVVGEKAGDARGMSPPVKANNASSNLATGSVTQNKKEG